MWRYGAASGFAFPSLIQDFPIVRRRGRFAFILAYVSICGTRTQMKTKAGKTDSNPSGCIENVLLPHPHLPSYPLTFAATVATVRRSTPASNLR